MKIHDPWIDEMCNQLLKFAFISNSVEQNKKFMIQWMKKVVIKTRSEFGNQSATQ